MKYISLNWTLALKFSIEKKKRMRDCRILMAHDCILDVRKIGHLNIKTKMLDIDARVLIGWYSLASQSERVPKRCFYVKVAYLSYGDISFYCLN